MVKFCPKCEKMLRRQKDSEGNYLLACVACGYEEEYVRDRDKKKLSKALEKKILDNTTLILDGSEDFELKSKTKVECPKCSHNEAFYEQFQTRSADEPATTFYQCTKCEHRWREY